MFLKRNCKQVTRLVLEAEDRHLPWVERLAVRIHMHICATCPRFQQQVRLMREATQAWRHYSQES
ncbi:MAG: zf-HC2 domain-containing protein [Pelomonas sp.]|nr:zf-HC2 domain-containing protein [Roseateles sp.]MBV8469946.1 zf-HC2 domain-containing protein [Burkholderiaceae bacterium]MBV8604596.1 zf-HC2 domain-containing protein [Roseateles sp.]